MRRDQITFMTETLAIEFEQLRAPLKSFIIRMTASVQDTEDIVQDTYVKAQENVDKFKGDSSLKTWIFSIASNLAKDRLRSQKRWPETVSDICKEAAMSNHQFFEEAMAIRQTSPQGNFEMREHVSMCFTCVSRSLPLEQQLTVFLKEVYQFSVKEVASILDTTDALVKYHLHVGRSKMIEIFDHRCSLINKEGVCHQCTELNGIFNPNQDAQQEKVKLSLVRAAEKGDKEHLFDLRMKILEELDPFESGAAELQLHHLEHNRQVMEDLSEKS